MYYGMSRGGRDLAWALALQESEDREEILSRRKTVR